MDILDKGMIHISGGMEHDDVRFHHPIRTVCSLEPINCLWTFPFNISGLQLNPPKHSYTTEGEIIGKGQQLG